jgi:hypothetical protein
LAEHWGISDYQSVDYDNYRYVTKAWNRKSWKRTGLGLILCEELRNAHRNRES